jgi:hypothetical protein
MSEVFAVVETGSVLFPLGQFVRKRDMEGTQARFDHDHDLLETMQGGGGLHDDIEEQPRLGGFGLDHAADRHALGKDTVFAGADDEVTDTDPTEIVATQEIQLEAVGAVAHGQPPKS